MVPPEPLHYSICGKEVMDALDEFANKIEFRLSSAAQTHWADSEIAQYMSEFAPRRERFETIAAHLLTDVIRPRMLRLGASFSNARVDRIQHPVRCILWFNYCDRFPANVKLEFSVEHDERVEHVNVLYEVRIMPTFLKFNAHDKLTLALEAIDDAKVREWVEEKMLEFVDTYLQIDRGPGDSEDELVTDPVCGMRLTRSAAGAKTDYYGHPYFFCSDTCRQRFEIDPKHYVEFRLID
jgi:YHS domain-containing protein